MAKLNISKVFYRYKQFSDFTVRFDGKGAPRFTVLVTLTEYEDRTKQIEVDLGDLRQYQLDSIAFIAKITDALDKRHPGLISDVSGVYESSITPLHMEIIRHLSRPIYTLA